MKDEYLTKRFSNTELAENIKSHYKRVPMLHILARHPFVCWIVAAMFSRSFCYEGYGRHPPRLTPFLIHFLVIQTNRRLKFYYDQKDNELVCGFFFFFLHIPTVLLKVILNFVFP